MTHTEKSMIQSYECTHLGTFSYQIHHLEAVKEVIPKEPVRWIAVAEGTSTLTIVSAEPN